MFLSDWFGQFVHFFDPSNDLPEQYHITHNEVCKHAFHVKQKREWDCGLASCAMVFKWLGRYHDETWMDTHKISLRQSPLWTIEVFLFLVDHGVNSHMYTDQCGFLSHENNLIWYAKHHENDEENYVSSLFAQAFERRLSIHNSSLESNQLHSMLCKEEDSIAICLINAKILFGRSFSSNVDDEGEFVGHFVIVLRYDSFTAEYFVLNPADDGGLLRFGDEIFEKARVHKGTDRDIIFCFK